MRSPLVWFGGKGRMIAKLLPLIPEHRTYAEVFGGGASLLFAKQPSAVEVYNDMDTGLVNFLKVLQDGEKFEELYRFCMLTPFSREEYVHFVDTWECIEDEVERAYRWYVVARWSFSGRFGGSWSYGIGDDCHSMAGHVSKWLSTVELLPAAHRRIRHLYIEHMSWEPVMEACDASGTFFYLDPPYIPETRKGGGYEHELTREDHETLVQRLLVTKGKCMLSGYAHPVYVPLEDAGWFRKDFVTSCFATGRTKATGVKGEGSATETQQRTETIWMNYNPDLNKSLLDELEETELSE